MVSRLLCEETRPASVERVLLVDQHPVVRRGLRFLMAQDRTIEIVGEAATVSEAEVMIQLTAPSVIILDLMTPPRPGISFIRRVKQSTPTPAVLVVTGEPAAVVLIPALEAGADGFINKDGAGPDYVAAVHTVAQQQLYLCRCAQRELVNALFDRERIRDRCKLANLNEIERHVLIGTVSGYSNGEVAAQLGLSVSAVEKLKAHVREKLELHRREDLVAFALRVGLLHEGGEEAAICESSDDALPWM